MVVQFLNENNGYGFGVLVPTEDLCIISVYKYEGWNFNSGK